MRNERFGGGDEGLGVGKGRMAVERCFIALVGMAEPLAN